MKLYMIMSVLAIDNVGSEYLRFAAEARAIHFAHTTRAEGGENFVRADA